MKLASVSVRPRFATPAVLALTLIALPAAAKPPPNAALPPCENEKGERVGACPRESPYVGGSASGRFSYNSTVDAYVDPLIPVCDNWNHNTGVISSSPCYSEVDAIQVVGCAYINVVTDRFQEVDCGSALYQRRPSTSTSGLFKSGGGPGFTCGGAGNYRVYVWGGPYTQKDKIWSYRGPRALHCAVAFLGEKPDGLYGPTWVKLRAGITTARGGRLSTCCSSASAEFYVPIDGDMRDLGPVAAFDVVSSEVGRVAFKNTSFHTQDESLTYRWDFGDGQSSTEVDPTHQYEKPGVYQVQLTATDASGDKDLTRVPTDVKFMLLVKLEATPENPKVGDDVKVKLSVRNPFKSAAERFALVGAFGLRMMSDFIVQKSGPDPKAPTTLGAGETATFEFVVSTLRSGRSVIEGGAQAWINDVNVSDVDQVTLAVPARLAISIATTIKAQTKVGDEFDVTATIRNDDEKEITNIKSEPLELVPADLVSIVSGPTSAGGADVRVSPISLAPGDSTTINWRYKADQKGTATLRALVNGTDPWTNELFIVSAKKRIAIESGGLDFPEFRMQPGSPIPGGFGTLRGTVTNIGSLAVKTIDFKLTSRPELKVVDGQLEKLAASASPRIASLAPGASQDFVIPVGMVSEPGALATYNFELTMTGISVVDGKDVEISETTSTAGGLDLTHYWMSVLDEVKRQLLDDTLGFFEGVNEWGDKSTLGGVAVGGTQGVLGAFQKMGDGLLTINDVLGEASGDGGQRLTKQGKAIVQSAIEYGNTRTLKEIRDDALALGYNLSQEGCKTMGDWLFAIEKANAKGNVREVTRLLTKPGTEFALALTGEVGVEQLASKIFVKAIKTPVGRVTPTWMKKKHVPPGDLPPARAYAADGDDLRDMPTGVAITGRTVAKAGLTIDEHAWMVKTAKEHGVAFFVRPRPADAAKYVDRGYNPKPMAIKTKSVSDIDAEWLGYDDYADQKGLVVLREPKDPFPKMLKAMNEGQELSPELVNKILDRYADRLAEYASRHDLLAKLNANGGFEIQRLGMTIKTMVSLDADGLMRFSHNNAPVFSDIDLLHIAKPDGTPIDPDLHRRISEEGGWGIDSQHGDTMSTSDFPNWADAKKFAAKYGMEHMRGGEPLVIVNADATTLGYVESMNIPDTVPNPNASDYGLFGQISVTYEGSGVK